MNDDSGEKTATNKERSPVFGKGTLSYDALIGNAVNSVVAGGLVALIGWLSDLDFSTAPGWLAALGAPAVALVTGWLTSRALPRFRR